MKKTYLATLLIALILVTCSGCAGKHCIAIDGSYDGIDGGIEYCYDSGKSDEIKSPVFVSPDGKVAFLLTEKVVKQALLRRDKSTVMSELGWKQAFRQLTGE